MLPHHKNIEFGCFNRASGKFSNPGGGGGGGGSPKGEPEKSTKESLRKTRAGPGPRPMQDPGTTQGRAKKTKGGPSKKQQKTIE